MKAKGGREQKGEAVSLKEAGRELKGGAKMPLGRELMTARPWASNPFKVLFSV